MPVYRLCEEMTYEELLGWFNYFERRPVEWRSDDRAAKLLQAQGVDQKPWQLFTSLEPIYNPPTMPEHSGNFNSANFKRSGFFQKIIGAKGGESIFS